MSQLLQDPSRLKVVSGGISWLLENPTAWRHRRTERFEIQTAEEVRRHVSVDFTVPVEVWNKIILRPDSAVAAELPGTEERSGATPYETAIATGRNGEWIVPLGWLARGPLVGFDLRQDGASLPLLLASEIEIVTRALLELELEVVLRDHPHGNDADITLRAAALIDDAVPIPPAEGVSERIDAFASDYGTPVDALVSLLRTSVDAFLLLVLVPSVDRRQLVKFAFDGPFDGPNGKRGARSVLLFQTPGVVEAASSHMESPLPAELRAGRWGLQHGQGSWLTTVVENSDHPALYVNEVDVRRKVGCLENAQETGIGVRAELFVERWRFHVPALALGVVASAALGYGGLASPLKVLTTDGKQGPVVTLLLAGIALFVGLLLRLDEHSLARRMLRVPRWLLIGILVAVLVPTAAAAFNASHLLLVWQVSCGVAGLLTLGLLVLSVRGRGPSSRPAFPRRRG